MSSGEDSETAEWEREQMLRGSRSRARPSASVQTGSQLNLDRQKPKSESFMQQDVIEAPKAKQSIRLDIEKQERLIETARKKIGDTRIEIAKSDKRLQAIQRQIELLESADLVYSELAVSKLDEMIEILNKNRTLLGKMPSDQIELLRELDTKLADPEIKDPMDVDQ